MPGAARRASVGTIGALSSGLMRWSKPCGEPNVNFRRMRGAFTMLACVLPAVLAGCGGGEDVANCAALRRTAPDKALEHCNRAIASRLVWSREKARARPDPGARFSDRGGWEAAICG